MISVFLSAVIVFGCLGGLTIGASAAGKITRKTVYGEDGGAIVTLTPSAAENYITYTDDGTAPKADSQKYGEEIRVYTETAFRAAEFTPAGSRVSGIKFTVQPRVAKVQFDVKYNSGSTTITLSTKTSNSRIYYTIDGTKPTAGSELYTSPITLVNPLKIRAVAVKEGFKDSVSASKEVTIKDIIIKENDAEKDSDEEEEDEKSTGNVLKYSVSYMKKGYSYIKFRLSSGNNVVRYTTDGTKPDKTSKKYNGKQLRIDEPCTIRAIEYSPSGNVVSSVKFSAKVKCVMPEIRCVDFGIGIKYITMSTDTPGASIYYTLDGTAPSRENGELYTGKTVIGDSTRVRAIAYKEGWLNSLTADVYADKIPIIIEDYKPDETANKEVATYINNYRVSAGCGELKLNDELCYAAAVRAKELYTLKSNYRPNGAYYSSIFNELNIPVGNSAEFIAVYAETPEELVNEILSVKNNTDLLKDKNYNSIGVGCFIKNKKVCWAVLITHM